MRIAFAVNDLNTELSKYTTTQLAKVAANHGHEVWYINIGDFALHPDNSVWAHARTLQSERHRSSEVYLRRLRSDAALHQEINIQDLDVLMLRNDPSQDMMIRPWARLASINFGRLAKRLGVLVLNDPDGLSRSLTKLYMQYFPEEVRPLTLITRNYDEARDFIASQGGYAVLKPLSGSGGHNVFLVRPHDTPNINQMLESVSSEGYVIVQEFLPDAIHGDTRLFLMNGEPLCIKRKYCAIHRMRRTGDADIRSNITAGAVARKAEVTDEMLHLAELVKPRLIRDGMFFVGLDIVGDKIMEINAQSPGGIYSAQQLEDTPFALEIIKAIERKLAFKKGKGSSLNNVELAVYPSAAELP